MTKHRLELLSPAKNCEIGIEAIKHGADAVYIGGPKFGARASACNSLDDIARLVLFAHQYDASVYVTINTIIYDDEIKDVERLINQLYVLGVDALIVQDMSILRMNIPPIALHASTQCDIRTVEKAQFLEQVGFSQIVLARELTLDEINNINNNVSIPVEAFIHGALCVSYSGRCQLSEVCMGRSANRGECAQMCRLPYDLCDDKGNTLLKHCHLLSLKDYNTSDELDGLIEAGVSSFKIEGRLKDVGYVKNVVSFYNTLLDKYVAAHSDTYERKSAGKVKLSFVPKLDKSFNRGFTTYFLSNRKPEGQLPMAAVDTPKSIGEYIGIVKRINGNRIRIETDIPLHNGDGISFFTSKGDYTGSRINKVEGKDIYLNSSADLETGAKIFRTFDKDFEDILSKDSATRLLFVDMSLSYANGYISLEIKDEKNNYVQEQIYVGELSHADKNQDCQQTNVLSKLGGTIYQVRHINVIGEYFIPSSLLARLRRAVISGLSNVKAVTYKFDYRRDEIKEAAFISERMTYADNVSNKISSSFYISHGVKEIEPAIEKKQTVLNGDEVLMNTRYCLRRELGACKMQNTGMTLPSKLFLVHDKIKLSVDCDCKKCEMLIRKS